jgi:Transmembrane protein 251
MTCAIVATWFVTPRHVGQLLSWTAMHFRQRVAWLSVAFYLVATAGCLYYIFEISAWFGKFSLEHADENHPEVGSPLRSSLSASTLIDSIDVGNAVLGQGQTALKLWALVGHIADIPQPLMIFLLLALYIQVCIYKLNYGKLTRLFKPFIDRVMTMCQFLDLFLRE